MNSVSLLCLCLLDKPSRFTGPGSLSLHSLVTPLTDTWVIASAFRGKHKSVLQTKGKWKKEQPVLSMSLVAIH